MLDISILIMDPSFMSVKLDIACCIFQIYFNNDDKQSLFLDWMFQQVSVTIKDVRLEKGVISAFNDRHIIENTCGLYKWGNLLIIQSRSCDG